MKESKVTERVIAMCLYIYCRRVIVLLAVMGFFLANNCLEIKAVEAPKKTKRPPLLVTTVEVEEGAVQAMTDLVGTTYFARVSEVATDLEGLVTEISFDEGNAVRRGDVLVVLDSQLLDAEIAAAQATLEQNDVDLQNARRDLERVEGLYKNGAISETDYDTYLAQKLRLEKLAAVLEAKRDKLLISKAKKNIRAPYSGIVVQQNTELGEWVAKGGRVAVIADNSAIEVEVDVPMEILENLEKGREVGILINGREYVGTFINYIPRGDIATRTFTARFSLPDANGIIEGQEALVSLPKGGETSGFVVPRDAVVDKYGKTMVFRVEDGKAVEVQVQVAGYVGLQAVVTSADLASGQKIVVKGAKRVEDGLTLQFR
jgi:RND family efflux transporter MFP subunit